MTPTKDQQAQEYAEKKIQETIPECYLHDEQIYDADDIKDAYKQAYSDGYTAAEQSLWRSVEDELPEENQTALCRLDDGEYIVARFDHMDVYNDDKGGVYAVPEWWVENGCENYTLGSEITHWMTIPSLPDTNTEKK